VLAANEEATSLLPRTLLVQSFAISTPPTHRRYCCGVARFACCLFVCFCFFVVRFSLLRCGVVVALSALGGCSVRAVPFPATTQQHISFVEIFLEGSLSWWHHE